MPRNPEFMIVATVEDTRVGEASFTADQLQITIRDALADLHLKVGNVSVVRPANVPPIPGARTVGAYAVKAEPWQPPQTSGEAHRQSTDEGEK